jgi:hypothetical protein
MTARQLSVSASALLVSLGLSGGLVLHTECLPARRHFMQCLLIYARSRLIPVTSGLDVLQNIACGVEGQPKLLLDAVRAGS